MFDLSRLLQIRLDLLNHSLSSCFHNMVDLVDLQQFELPVSYCQCSAPKSLLVLAWQWLLLVMCAFLGSRLCLVLGYCLGSLHSCVGLVIWWEEKIASFHRLIFLLSLSCGILWQVGLGSVGESQSLFCYSSSFLTRFWACLWISPVFCERGTSQICFAWFALSH